MPLSQREIALQMIAQLRLLDPSVSAEIGTPERKIIDTVAQSLTDSQIDLVALQAALDLDSKFGASLDRFLALFGFGRQRATYATGFVTFSRQVAATAPIRIPAGTQVRALPVTTAPGDTTDAVFYTTFDVVLPSGDLTIPAPIRASLAGAHANVAAGTITTLVSKPVGITGVTNQNATSGGKDIETDDEYKVRFKNTVFRNLAGTTDQYLALAVATAFSTKANVVGPISRYREYIQVPPVADNASYDVDGDGNAESGAGSSGAEYTSALSTIPFSKHVYDTVPYFVSNGEVGPLAVFYRHDVDFRMNTVALAKDKGDTRRFHIAATPLGLDPNTEADTEHQPNVTFLNIYTGVDETIQAIRPGDVVLFEHSYMSDASRNDVTLNISNAVDVYVDGGNEVVASNITTRPTTDAVFVNDTTSKYHYDNYRRIGEPEHRPLLGNILLPLFWQPVTGVPEQIVVGTNTYFRDTHYWGVQDVSELAGTIRARNGIEWSGDVKGKAQSDPDEGPYTGLLITGHPSGTALEIENYIYDRNIVDLQASLDANKQTTTDVLAHKARLRFFKLDITIMYDPGASIAETNLAINSAVQRFLSGLYFGSTVQLSDLLQVVHGVPGVDNVRWSSDVPGNEDLVRVYETDTFGRPLVNVLIDQYREGTGLVSEIQQIVITGSPASSETTTEQSTFTLTYNGNTTATIDYDADAATILARLNAAPVSANIASVTGTGTPQDPWRVTFNGTGAKNLIVANSSLVGGPTVIKSDFFLKDDELASLPTQAYTPTVGIPDTVPGLIIRPRAQNTWTRV